MGLVTLDVRQESTRHSDAIDTVTQYLGLGSYKAWDEEQRLNFLIGELTGKRPLMPPGTFSAAECCRQLVSQLVSASMCSNIILSCLQDCRCPRRSLTLSIRSRCWQSSRQTLWARTLSAWPDPPRTCWPLCSCSANAG